MNPETLVALQKSIEHWERLATGTSKEEEGVGRSHCDLCKLFYPPIPPLEWENAWDCAGCPVRQATGFRFCANTPYNNANAASRLSGKLSPEFQLAAAKELAFLKSLLPEQQTATEALEQGAK